MYLVRLVLASEQSEDICRADIEDFVGDLQRGNERDQLTGFLLTDRPFFVQCLEGKRGIVGRLLERLYRDPRHHSLRIVSLRELDTREFSYSAMRLIELDQLDEVVVRHLCLKHGIDLPLYPTAVREVQLHAWLRELYELSFTVAESRPAPTDCPARTPHAADTHKDCADTVRKPSRGGDAPAPAPLPPKPKSAPRPVPASLEAFLMQQDPLSTLSGNESLMG